MLQDASRLHEDYGVNICWNHIGKGDGDNNVDVGKLDFRIIWNMLWEYSWIYIRYYSLGSKSNLCLTEKSVVR